MVTTCLMRQLRRWGHEPAHGHRKTTTPTDGERIGARVRHILAPTHIVIVDNLSRHKRAAARELIEAAGADLRFRPPCSPDVNPVEMAVS